MLSVFFLICPSYDDEMHEVYFHSVVLNLLFYYLFLYLVDTLFLNQKSTQRVQYPVGDYVIKVCLKLFTSILHMQRLSLLVSLYPLIDCVYVCV